ncbi:MAG: hypothetical protein ACYSUC_07425 [Planctomycetota bacterium]|jgi:hypothetical protein
MEDFELRLKRIPLVKPPGDMKEKIFASEPGRPRILGVFRHRIPLGWAAMFAILTGLAGMSLSQWLRPAAVPGKAVVMQTYILEAPSERNPFDFTETGTDFMSGELSVKVKPPEEI